MAGCLEQVDRLFEAGKFKVAADVAAHGLQTQKTPEHVTKLLSRRSEVRPSYTNDGF
jgi:hypothetical protein